MTAMTRPGRSEATLARQGVHASSTLVRTTALGFREARPQVQVVFLLRLVVGNCLGANGHEVDVGTLVQLDLSWFLASWFVYLVNGLSDIEGDRRNGSRRPLVQGLLSTRVAVCMSVGLAAGSMLIVSMSGLVNLLMVVAFLALGFVYSFGPRPSKNFALTASLTVGCAGFATFIFGAFASGHHVDLEIVLVAAVLGAWMLVAGNAKDFGDELGDRVAGRRTLPIVLGSRSARRVVTTAVTIVGSLAVVVGVRSPQLLPLALLLPSAVAMGVLALAAEIGCSSPRAACRIFTGSQYAVNIALIVTFVVR
jgi:4-hydroxybenzoate polyprenyltransferase